MAEEFDKTRAATDLKELLKMNDKTKSGGESVQSEAAHTKSSNNGQTTGSFKVERDASEIPQDASPGKFTSTHTNSNSNGNALLTVVMKNQSALSVLKQENQGGSGVNDDKGMAVASGEVDKSVKKSPKVKNGKKSKGANIKKSSGASQENSLVPRKNSSASKHQNKQNERVGDAAENSNDSSINRDSQSQGTTRGENPSSINNAKPRHVKLGEPDISSDFLLHLEENKMHQLKKRSVKFPKAKFFCRLCDYHLDLPEDCVKHMKDSKHSRRKTIHDVDAILRTVPKPTEQHITALTAAVDKVYEEHGINESEQKQRAEVVSRLENMLQQSIPEVVMSMYGSSLTGLGLKTADINVNLTSTNANKKLTSLLLEVHEILIASTDDGFSSVKSDFSAKVPGVLLTDDHTGLTIHVVIHCYSAHCSSELLSIYSSFDIRVRKLAVAFRYWAHICGLDWQHDGFIPPQALNLMVIYFLQNITPQVVPIVQPPKVSGEDVGDFKKDAPKFQKMRSKVVGVKMAKSNSMSVGELWLKLLRYYSLEFDFPNCVVSIRCSQDVSRNSKPWNNKKLAVEDPYMLKKNITCTVSISHVYEYWQDSIRKAFRYFGYPRNSADRKFSPTQEHKTTTLDANETAQPVDVRGHDKKSEVDTSVHDKFKTVASVQVESHDSDKKDVPDEKEKTVDKDGNSPVVIAPNPLLSCRVTQPSQANHLQCESPNLSCVYISHSASQDLEPSAASSAHGPGAKASSDDSNIQGNHSAASGIASQDCDKAQPVAASHTIIPPNPLLKPVSSSHLSSLVTSLEQLSIHSPENAPLQVSLPQPLCHVDSSEKADNDTLALSDCVVSNALEERKDAQADSCVCESNTDIGGMSQNSCLPGARLCEVVAQGHVEDVEAASCSELLNKPTQPSSVHDTSSQNVAQINIKDADTNVELLHDVSSDQFTSSQNVAQMNIKDADTNVELPHDVSSDQFTNSHNVAQINIKDADTNVQLLHDIKPAESSDQFTPELTPSEASAGRAETRNEGTTEHQEEFSIVLRGCYYEFTKANLTDGKGPTLLCTFCDKEGHMKNDCPENNLPEILPLPPLTPFHIKVLSKTLGKVPAEVGLSEEGLAEREIFMKGLEEFIQVQFSDAKLSLFGSSCNGFGFDKSDMDICMTFTQRKIGDKAFVIESLARKMKQHMDLTDVQAIPTAKVPIVKFTVRKTGLEGDISLYNTLAQQNTKLLLCYNKVDPRVNILGYTIKTFAKVCDIGDASRGSLSSYAYVLMMLYYLQQVKPPVIPVLQELYKGDQKPEFLVEGWDAWFQDNLSLLDELWPEKGKNQMSVAELWLGFLCFYVEEFKYKEHVVSIRQKLPLTRFEKLWNGPCIAIEDPFDLSHNLGSGLTRTMNSFIFKTFINGRMLYGSPIDENMDMFNKYQRPSDYFFDTDLLSECRPPNVRGCRRCGKVGHLVRHCPATLKDKEDEQKRLQQQKQLQQQQAPQQGRLNSSQQQYSNRQQLQQQHQRIPLPQMQQRTHGHMQQQNERDMRGRRELDRRQNDPNANINRNASAPSSLGHNYNLTPEAPVPAEALNMFADMARLMLATSANNQQTFPNNTNLTATGSLRGRVHVPTFSNGSFQQPYNHHSGYNVMVPAGTVHPTSSVMQQSARHNNLNAVDYASQRVHPNAFYQQGYPQAHQGFGGWPPHNNRGPQGQFDSQRSFNNNGGSANFQGMNPRVQNLFAGATGQMSNDGANQTHRRK